MFKMMSEMEAVVETAPTMMTVFNRHTQEQDPHYAYMAEIQYKRKAPVARLILCDRLDTVIPGNTVMISYHMGMRVYQHSRHLVISNNDNCVGGFYYTDGNPA